MVDRKPLSGEIHGRTAVLTQPSGSIFDKARTEGGSRSYDPFQGLSSAQHNNVELPQQRLQLFAFGGCQALLALQQLLCPILLLV